MLACQVDLEHFFTFARLTHFRRGFPEEKIASNFKSSLSRMLKTGSKLNSFQHRPRKECWLPISDQRIKLLHEGPDWQDGGGSQNMTWWQGGWSEYHDVIYEQPPTWKHGFERNNAPWVQMELNKGSFLEIIADYGQSNPLWTRYRLWPGGLLFWSKWRMFVPEQ